MSDFKNYFEFAFYHTLVQEYMANNIYAINGNGKVYYDDGSKCVKTFPNEEKALEYLLKTLDISTHYKFYDVFYDVKNSIDGKLKYDNYMCVIIRKTYRTRNQVYSFLSNPCDSIHNGKLVEDIEFTKDEGITKDTPFNTVDKDLTRLCGMELEPIIQCALKIEDDTLYDLRDNFIVDEIVPKAKDDNKITCNILFDHIIQAYKLANKYSISEDKTNIHPDIALVDITGSYIKTTGLFDTEEPIIINDSLDIYREFIGGTIKKEEDFDDDTTKPKDEDNPNDSDYT